MVRFEGIYVRRGVGCHKHRTSLVVWIADMFFSMYTSNGLQPTSDGLQPAFVVETCRNSKAGDQEWQTDLQKKEL